MSPSLFKAPENLHEIVKFGDKWQTWVRWSAVLTDFKDADLYPANDGWVVAVNMKDKHFTSFIFERKEDAQAELDNLVFQINAALKKLYDERKELVEKLLTVIRAAGEDSVDDEVKKHLN